jgi:chemotaxis protein MotB
MSACAGRHGPVVYATSQCPPPPPLQYAPECVTKHQVVDVVGALSDENDVNAAQLAELERALGQIRSTVVESLKKSLAAAPSGTVQVVEIGGKIRVRLTNELLFPSGSAKLSAAGARALDQVAAVLVTVKSKRIEIAGHTDDAPVTRGWDDNWQLSADRARQVALHLMQRGLPRDHLYIGGYADTDPVERGSTETARARNRRVELFVEPSPVDQATAKADDGEDPKRSR